MSAQSVNFKDAKKFVDTSIFAKNAEITEGGRFNTPSTRASKLLANSAKYNSSSAPSFLRGGPVRRVMKSILITGWLIPVGGYAYVVMKCAGGKKN